MSECGIFEKRKESPSELGRRGRTLLQWRRQRRQHKSSGGDEDVGEAGQIIIMSLLLLKRQKAFAVTMNTYTRSTVGKVTRYYHLVS